jgi:hypothetical protein
VYDDTADELLLSSQRCYHNVENHDGFVVNCDTGDVYECSRRTKVRDANSIMVFTVGGSVVCNENFKGNLEFHGLGCILPKTVVDNNSLLSVTFAEGEWIALFSKSISDVSSTHIIPLLFCNFLTCIINR